MRQLAAGADCTISVTFTPSASGSRTAWVSITDNASGSPQTVSLSGIGTSTAAAATAPPSSLSPTSLSFGKQPIDVPSTTQTVSMGNTGNATLNNISLELTGTNASDFTETDNCSSVAVGAYCTIGVMFTPSVAGLQAASLSISDNASGSPQTVSLSGTGSHDVILTWTASTAPRVGYNVYRCKHTFLHLLSTPRACGTASGGESATPLNFWPINGTTYCDATVQAGQTYYYVVIAVALNDVTQLRKFGESANSNQVPATVPSP